MSSCGDDHLCLNSILPLGGACIPPDTRQPWLWDDATGRHLARESDSTDPVMGYDSTTTSLAALNAFWQVFPLPHHGQG